MKISLRIIIGIIPFLWTACVIPVNNHKVPNFYLLLSKPDDAYKSNSNGEISFYIEEVRLAQYLQDERLIARPEDEIIEFRENERWGEPLELGIGRVVGQNLSDLLGTLNYGFFPKERSLTLKMKWKLLWNDLSGYPLIRFTLKLFGKFSQKKVGFRGMYLIKKYPLLMAGLGKKLEP